MVCPMKIRAADDSIDAADIFFVEVCLLVKRWSAVFC